MNISYLDTLFTTNIIVGCTNETKLVLKIIQIYTFFKASLSTGLVIIKMVMSTKNSKITNYLFAF